MLHKILQRRQKSAFLRVVVFCCLFHGKIAFLVEILQGNPGGFGHALIPAVPAPEHCTDHRSVNLPQLSQGRTVALTGQLGEHGVQLLALIERRCGLLCDRFAGGSGFFHCAALPFMLYW